MPGSLKLSVNEYIQPPIDPPGKLPTIEELWHHFAVDITFSKLDAKAGYWSIHLSVANNIPVTLWKILLPEITIWIESYILGHLPNV